VKDKLISIPRRMGAFPFRSRTRYFSEEQGLSERRVLAIASGL